MVIDDVFAVIAEATRRDILVSLRAGDKAVGELVEELGASQPTVSKHLKVLREAGLVTMRAQGQKRYYSLSSKPLLGIAEWLDPFDVPGRAVPAAPQPDGVHPDGQPAAAEANGGRAQETGLSAAALVESVPAPAGGAARRPAASSTVTSQQIGRSIGQAANKAAEVFANLPKLRRRRD
ncbi:winged helix-turn-helix domain-containing protein [Paenarthrobacter sp. DKR-5]|uniref:ArsR/SmtB family transcription factor n=1 Tax=Paenarthrobacter sp. DKR-5 TaxID=2835535 RepID=UPI001BDBD390|nr:metalloregulator ArsR/SmtB family transcription factor [Paenarthrobacter sp. DKR-5]MBT1001318.1 winged helix-turn-helix domain-containing protein [Paenarthrobacter sp. DKR-5]